MHVCTFSSRLALFTASSVYRPSEQLRDMVEKFLKLRRDKSFSLRSAITLCCSALMGSYFVLEACVTLKVVQAAEFFRLQQTFKCKFMIVLYCTSIIWPFVQRSTFAQSKRVSFLPRKKLMRKKCLFPVSFFLFCDLELRTRSAAHSCRNRNRKKLPETLFTHLHRFITVP